MNWYYFRVPVLKYMVMENNSNTSFSPQSNTSMRFTPRELIRYHIEHPEVPITDIDIENLILDEDWREEYPVFNKSSNTNFLNNNHSFLLL